MERAALIALIVCLVAPLTSLAETVKHVIIINDPPGAAAVARAAIGRAAMPEAKPAVSEPATDDKPKPASATAARMVITYEVEFENGKAQVRIPYSYLAKLPEILASLRVSSDVAKERLRATGMFESKELNALIPIDAMTQGVERKFKIGDAEFDGKIVAKDQNWVLVFRKTDNKLLIVPSVQTIPTIVESEAPAGFNDLARFAAAGCCLIELQLGGGTKKCDVTIELPTHRRWTVNHELRLIADTDKGEIRSSFSVANPTLQPWKDITVREGNVSLRAQDARLAPGTVSSFANDGDPPIVTAGWLLEATLDSPPTVRAAFQIINDQPDAKPLTEGPLSLWSQDQFVGRGQLPSLPAAEIPAVRKPCVTQKAARTIELTPGILSLETSPKVVSTIEDVSYSQDCVKSNPHLKYRDVREYSVQIRNLTSATLPIKVCDPQLTLSQPRILGSEQVNLQLIWKAKDLQTFYLPGGLTSDPQLGKKLLVEWTKIYAGRELVLANIILEIAGTLIKDKEALAKDEVQLTKLIARNNPAATLPELQIVSDRILGRQRVIFDSEKALADVESQILKCICGPQDPNGQYDTLPARSRLVPPCLPQSKTAREF